MANEKPSITPLDGKTTVDDKVRFEPERLSYQSASLIAERIAQRVSKELGGWSVVIVDTSTVADIANLEASFFELTQLANDYVALAERAVQLHERRSERSEDSAKTNLPPGSGIIQESFVVAPVITAATTAISAGLGLMSLFRQDVELHGTETSIDSLTFKIALAEQLRSKTKVLIAELYVPYEEDLSKSKLQHLMAQVRAARSKTWKIVSPMISALVRLDTQLDQAAKNKDQQKLDELSTHISAIRRDVQPVTDSLKEIDGRLAAIEKLWAQVDSVTGFTVLARMLRAESLRSFGVPLLHAAVVASGGTTRTIRNLWRTLWSGDGVSFSGGAVARWALLGNDGVFIKGGVETVTATYKDDAPVSIRSSESAASESVSLCRKQITFASFHGPRSTEEISPTKSQPEPAAESSGVNSETHVRDAIPE